MPFTPFHFGIGLAIKGAARPLFSWSAFVAAQVLIDCESLYYLLQREYPVHRFFHSFIGATAMGLIAAVAWILLVGLAKLLLPRLVLPWMHPTSPVSSEFSSFAVIVGGLLGGASHTFLDAVMHRDVRPFLPFSDHNPFLGLIGVGTLHMACVVAGIVGLIGVTLWGTRPAK